MKGKALLKAGVQPKGNLYFTEEVLERPVNYGSVLSSGDAYWTISAGVPAVFYGPGDLKVAHINNERVPLDELEAVARIFALYTLRMLR